MVARLLDDRTYCVRSAFTHFGLWRKLYDCSRHKFIMFYQTLMCRCSQIVYCEVSQIGDHRLSTSWGSLNRLITIVAMTLLHSLHDSTVVLVSLLRNMSHLIIQFYLPPDRDAASKMISNCLPSSMIRSITLMTYFGFLANY